MKRDYLVCYDIADPKRLQKVHRRVANEAEFIQLSVYHLSADQESLEAFVAALDELIDQHADDVRIYPLSLSAELETWGRERRVNGLYLLE